MADAGTIRKPSVGTLTRADLADTVHREIGLSRADSAGIVERILHHMCAALADGQNVKVSGFGSFILRDKGERIGRTDFPMGNHQHLIDAITRKLWPLGDDTAFIPGHGPMSTFGQERRTNPFVADRVLARA